MNTDIFILITSIVGALTSLIAAIATFRREENKTKVEAATFLAQEEDRKDALRAKVAEDTTGLYQKLADQYAALTEKDKRLLRTVTTVIRNLIYLERTIGDLVSEIENRWEDHFNESATVACPFYSDMTEYTKQRLERILTIVTDTLDDTDKLLFNGSSPVIPRDGKTDT